VNKAILLALFKVFLAQISFYLFVFSQIEHAQSGLPILSSVVCPQSCTHVEYSHDGDERSRLFTHHLVQ